MTGGRVWGIGLLHRWSCELASRLGIEGAGWKQDALFQLYFFLVGVLAMGTCPPGCKKLLAVADISVGSFGRMYRRFDRGSAGLFIFGGVVGVVHCWNEYWRMAFMWLAIVWRAFCWRLIAISI